MSRLPEGHDHRPRTATPPEPRRPPRIDLGATWSLSAVRKDLHDLARVARTFGALQLCAADSRRVSGSPPEIPSSKPHRTAKIRPVCQIPPPCADGHTGDCSASAAGLRPDRPALLFLRAPTILAWDLGALCRILPSRQEVRESSSSRRVETADSVAGLSAGS